MPRVRPSRDLRLCIQAPCTLALLCVLLSSACDGRRGNLRTAPMPDFSLQDVNPASVTFEERVSPREFEGLISAWYFGHAT